jgi:hypothetical protein
VVIGGVIPTTVSVDQEQLTQGRHGGFGADHRRSLHGNSSATVRDVEHEGHEGKEVRAQGDQLVSVVETHIHQAAGAPTNDLTLLVQP